jgi:cell division protein YceG involved in septum cleavage
MSGFQFGVFLIVLIVGVFILGFFNFKARAEREIARFKVDAETSTQRLMQALRDQENAEGLLHKETYIVEKANEQMRVLEDRLDKVEDMARRIEDVSEKTNKRNE